VKILGHNFLRSNFTRVSPLHWFGRHLQENRIANILKDIEGIGCHVSKPTNADGRGWMIVNDGRSDVPLPPGFPMPYNSRSGLFAVHSYGLDRYAITGYNKELTGGVYMVGAQVGTITAGNGLAFVNDTWECTDIADDTHQAVWLEMDRKTNYVTIISGQDFPDGRDSKYAYTEIVPLWFFKWDTDSEKITTIYDMRHCVRLPAMA